MWHRTRWAVLLLACALAASAWAGELAEEEKSPEQKFAEYVDKRLKKLDREVREFRAKDASAARRIDELEAQVLAARSRIARLEAKLGTMRLLLDAARRELAKTATPRRPPTAPGIPTTTKPAPGTTPKEIPARIVTQHRRDSGNDIIITGTVKNVAKRPLTFILVRAAFLDRDNGVISTKEAPTNPRIIPPGGRASFRIIGRYHRRIRRYTLSVRTN